ncbi:MAG: 3-hydroxyacyl-CoA dehydrogenase [Paracoccaceae bacterium]
MSILSPVAVIGTGTMGRGIVQVFAQAGSEVIALDANREAAEAARAQALAMIDKLAAKGRLAPELAASAPDRITVASELSALAGCALVVEAVAEDLQVKRALFCELEGIVGAGCILATNTSSLSVTEIAAGCARPGRVAGFHFFNPVPLMKVVEVIGGLRSEAAVLDRLDAYARSFGHVPVRAADAPGFLVNHAARGLTTEGLRIVQERVATPQQVDAILEGAAGFRLGPFALLDLTGLDVSSKVFDLIYHGFYQEPRFRPSPMLPVRVAAGLYGRKSGEGFYAYSEGSRQQAPEPSRGPGDGGKVWLGAVEAPWRAGIAALFPPEAVDDGAEPGSDSALILAPLGRDATSETVALGLDPARAVAIDPLFGPASEGGRLTVMGTPATLPRIGERVVAWLASGRPVTVIGDSPGFVAQRTLATIVNIASDIAQQGIATPQDIDLGTRLGLGYPQGPLQWADAIGAAHLLRILDALHRVSGDPRYRASPWLRRRVSLGLPLAATPAWA